MASQVLLRALTCLMFLKLIITLHQPTLLHMGGFIVGGNYSVIEDFPHVAFLRIQCQKVGATFCGASIVNQVILLTAAHCFHSCTNINNFTISAYTGSVKKYKGHNNQVIGFRVHEHYNHHNFTNDIAMLILKHNLEFGKGAQKITLMKHLPKYTRARIAGWGWIDDHNTKTDVLKYTSQRILSYKECLKKLPGIPKGTICGFNPSGDHPQRGDSGSALVIHEHIQIGIASFFRRKYCNKTLVYTDVTYFYDWIQKTAKSMFCQFKKKEIEIEKQMKNDSNRDMENEIDKTTLK